MSRKRFWLPITGLTLFFVIFVTSFYLFLAIFDPHIPINQAEWEPKKPNSKKSFWIRVIQKQLQSPKK